MTNLAISKRAKLFRIAALILTTLASAAVTTANAQTFTVLYNFGTGWSDPHWPTYGPITQGRDGNLYGTTFMGGATNAGSVFEITPGGTLTVVSSLGGDVGYDPLAGVTLGTDGNFYCADNISWNPSSGYGYGTVFKLAPNGNLALLYAFTDGSDGAYPASPPVQGIDGNFYGTTPWGGTYGDGVVYKLTPAGQLTSLHEFNVTDGAYPGAPLVQATDGSFYGTTLTCCVFKITPSGKFTTLGATDGLGSGAGAPLVQGSDGNFYGTAWGGGTYGGGMVYKVTPADQLTVVHNFNPTTDGANPEAGLVQATDGNFYGVTSSGGTLNYGTIYRVGSDGSFAVLYNFDGTTGSSAWATLVQHTDGILYGDTYGGGIYGGGTFYSLDVGLGPFVSLLPATRAIGQSVGILGQGFTGTTSVSFNGTAATFAVKRDTYLVAIVPAGATTGPVTVTTPSGTLTSNVPFRVRPGILSFSPPSGPVGTSVILTGSGLTQTTTVSFGGVRATSFTVNSDTQITATVPTGAQTGEIVVLTPGGTAYSPGSFTVTP